MEEDKKIKVKDQWAEKYVKDNIWFPFGTIVNGWVTLKKDDPNYTLEQYKKDIKELYKIASAATITTYKIYEKLELDTNVAKQYSSRSIPIKE